jgi:hypothetical protein
MKILGGAVQVDPTMDSIADMPIWLWEYLAWFGALEDKAAMSSKATACKKFGSFMTQLHWILSTIHSN